MVAHHAQRREREREENDDADDDGEVTRMNQQQQLTMRRLSVVAEQFLEKQNLNQTMKGSWQLLLVEER